MSGHLLLLAVPGTGTDDRPAVRVVVVPQLDAAESVAAAGLANWPTMLSDTLFTVEVARSEPEPGEAYEADVAPVHNADPLVWSEFFTGVRVAAAERATFAEVPVVTTTSDQAAAVDDTYRAVAQVDIDPTAVVHTEFDQRVADELRTNWVVEETVPAGPGEPRALPSHDFHLLLTRLREHPAVMRALGLIFELPVDTELGLRGTIRVGWSSAPLDGIATVSPRTAYEVDDDGGFLPASTALVTAGMLDLGDTAGWSMSTFDIDGAVGRLRDAARADSVDGRGLPPLRSAGIQLLRTGLTTDMAALRANAAANSDTANLTEAPPLTADDLILGIRLDVRQRGDINWTSLCRRTASYAVNDRPIPTEPEEEGHVKFGVAVRDGDGTLTADEVVARWTGWSLAAPRPGPRPARPARAGLPFRFDWDFVVPTGSLIPLRFGSDYQLRGRIADIAGGGIGYRNRDAGRASEWVPYTRHQPIAAPVLTGSVEPDAAGPGDRVDLVVLRGDAPEYPDNTGRVLAAPTGTLDLAEQHDRLNATDETTVDCLRQAAEGALRDWASEGLTFFPVPEPGNPDEDPQYFQWPHAWPATSAWAVRLVARDGDDTIEPDLDRDDLLWVRLGPAEQLTVEVSSLPRNQITSQLALQRWRETAADDQAVKSGRHPMVTPARRLSFVHAVRAPLAAPAGTLTPHQEAGDTAAELTPSTPLLGIDPPSTVQLQVTASWTEYADDRQVPMADVRVQDVAVERGDTALREVVTHSFGDTRHRMIGYTLTAVSRFRYLYHRDEDDRLFVRSTPLPPVSILSTVRPAPPAVRAVVPAIRWRTEEAGPRTWRRMRVGGLLRVELHRPWFVTGEGERLAVVVDHTEAGRDPIWQTGAVPHRPPLSAYAPADHRQVKPPDGPVVTVVPYEAVFAEDRWCADVELPGLVAASYRPFVRLAVARYQSQSLADHELSSVVRTDLVQLLPDRTLGVEVSGTGLVVRLDGLGPAGPHPNRVEVVVERRTGEQVEVTTVDGAAGVPGWRAVATGAGDLGRPITVAHDGGGDLRVRVREVETFDPEHRTAEHATTVAELDDRVVFTDVVTLTGDLADSFGTDPTDEFDPDEIPTDLPDPL